MPPPQQRQRSGGDQERRGHSQTHGLRLHPRRPRRAYPAVLHRHLQSLSELSSSVRASRHRHRRERPLPLRLPPLSDATGNPARLAPARTVSAPRIDPRRLATHCRNPQRHRSRAVHAAGQAQTLRAVAAAGQRAVEMTDEENPRNPKPGISLVLGKRKRRASHIPTAPKAATLFPESNPERSFPPPLSYLLLQAHPWIGKDSRPWTLRCPWLFASFANFRLAFVRHFGRGVLPVYHRSLCGACPVGY